jgi:hypothetical protein
MKDTGFVECLNKSKIAANHVIKFLEQNGYNVVDLQNNKDFYKKDIDLKLTDDDNNEIFVEVKTDFYKRKQNVCVETISNCTTNKPGWIHYTQADYIMFYLSLFRELYVIKTDELKDLITNNEYPKKYTETTDKNKNITYFGEIVLVPLDDLEQKANKIIL